MLLGPVTIAATIADLVVRNQLDHVAQALLDRDFEQEGVCGRGGPEQLVPCAHQLLNDGSHEPVHVPASDADLDSGPRSKVRMRWFAEAVARRVFERTAWRPAMRGERMLVTSSARG
jgi:hypothetical protein